MGTPNCTFAGIDPERGQDFDRRYSELVQTGMAANPPPQKRTGKRGKPAKSDALNLLIRMQQYQDMIQASTCLIFTSLMPSTGLNPIFA